MIQHYCIYRKAKTYQEIFAETEEKNMAKAFLPSGETNAPYKLSEGSVNE